jgi:hypothetical protein
VIKGGEIRCPRWLWRQKKNRAPACGSLPASGAAGDNADKMYEGLLKRCALHGDNRVGWGCGKRLVVERATSEGVPVGECGWAPERRNWSGQAVVYTRLVCAAGASMSWQLPINTVAAARPAGSRCMGLGG